MKLNLFCILFAFAILSGCQTAPLALNYTPSSLVQGKGEIQVQEFKYTPAETGKVSADQIKNTALGQIHLGQPISKFVTNAFSSEFKYAGYTLDSSKGTLTGDIQELIADDLGFSVDWTLKAKVELKDKSGKLLASKDLMVKKSFEKFSGFQTAMNMVLKEAFEQMMADPQIKKQIK